ncbi:MAG: ROK family protein [Candidatus Omnitrophota bacterium]
MDKTVIAMDIGGTIGKVAIIKLNCKRFKLLAKLEINTAFNKSVLLKVVISNIKRLSSGAKNSKEKIIGIGIGLPGQIDAPGGIVKNLTNIAGWKNVHLKKIIEAETKLPTFIDNDVNCMCLGEYFYGAGRNTKDMVAITLGTGVGGGIIIGGKLYRGATQTAGEIGHVCLDMNGPRCNCGGYGCLERYVGNRYIVEEAVRRLKKKGVDSSLKNKLDGNYTKLTPELLSQAADEQDAFSIKLWKDIGRYIGVVLAGMVNVINPEKIVIGGGVAQAGAILFSAIEEQIKKRALAIPAGQVKVIPAKLGRDAGVIGAAVMAYNAVSL